MRRLGEVGMEAIAAHEKELTAYTLQQLQALPQITVYGSADPRRLDDRLGVISFNVQGMHHGKVAAILGFEGGIAVRHGCFCAHPYVVHLLGLDEAEQEAFRGEIEEGDRRQMPGLVRVSFGCYNNREDVDHLLHLLRRICNGAYEGEYVVDPASGTYLPRQFDMDLIRSAFSI
jgi:selenocysteine lyase/cysteine desulfurase